MQFGFIILFRKQTLKETVFYFEVPNSCYEVVFDCIQNDHCFGHRFSRFKSVSNNKLFIT